MTHFPPAPGSGQSPPPPGSAPGPTAGRDLGYRGLENLPARPPRGRRLMVAGLVLMLVALLLGGLAGGLAYYSFGSMGAGLEQILLPGERTVTIAKPGLQKIFIEHASVFQGRHYGSSNDPDNFTLTVTDPQGQDVPVTLGVGHETYTFTERRGESYGQFMADQPGAYRIKGLYDTAMQVEVMADGTLVLDGGPVMTMDQVMNTLQQRMTLAGQQAMPFQHGGRITVPGPSPTTTGTSIEVNVVADPSIPMDKVQPLLDAIHAAGSTTVMGPMAMDAGDPIVFAVGRFNVMSIVAGGFGAGAGGGLGGLLLVVGLVLLVVGVVKRLAK